MFPLARQFDVSCLNYFSFYMYKYFLKKFLLPSKNFAFHFIVKWIIYLGFILNYVLNLPSYDALGLFQLSLLLGKQYNQS